MTGNVPLAFGAGAGALGLSLAGFGVRVTNEWFTTPRDRLGAWVGHLRRDHGEDLDVLPDVHGAERLTADGALRMADGRHVALVRVEGRNTAMLDPDERHTVAAALSSAVDEQIRDLPFRFYSTTRETAVDDVAERYRERAWAGETTETQGDLLLDTAEWLQDADAPNWSAREWRHYVVVEADALAVRGGMPSPLSRLNPFDDGDTVPEADVRATLRDRVETAVDAIGSVSGLTAAPATSAETLDVARRYWGRSGEVPSVLAADLEAGEVEVGRVTAPETFDPRNGWVDLGEEYARTLWLSEFPREPESLWLKPLTSLRGVDVDLCVNVEPEPTDSAVAALGNRYANVGAEQADRAEAGDVSAGDAARANDSVADMRALIRETPSEAWNVSVYVTVRVRDEDALEAAEDAVDGFDDLDAGRLSALDDATETVRETLSQSPVNATALTPGVTQGQAFRAGSPLTGDVWDAETRAPKTRLVPGAVVGSMFPPATADLREPSGMDWGRNEENGTHLRLSPFERGGAPHMLTIGQTRSGKTYAATKAALRWYLERDDRTLIVADTQRGFEGLTEACDGKHVVVDGAQAVNPLRLEPPEDDDRAAAEFRLTVEETVGFLLGLLRADGVEDAGEYAPLLSQAAEHTLTEAGADPEHPETFADVEAHLGDLLETLVDMNEDPDPYTWSGEGVEGEIHERQVGELLTRFRSFQDGGKYHRLVGEDEIGIVADDVDMAYLDLHALDGDDAEKSAMLQLMLGQVREKIKQAPGETLLLLDEAHVLLDSPRTADWLQRAAREFARYEACLWYLSQSPQDFVSGEDETPARDTIREQCSMTHAFRTPGVDPDVLARFGMNERQREFVRNGAVRGRSGRGFSECLLGVVDVEGWLPCYVEASPAEHAAIAEGDL